jgi:putative PIN family toxin of toxin-antitoxin system
MRSSLNIAARKELCVLKVVIDTNVWVSALLTSGTARKLINCLKINSFQLVYSAQIFDELLEVTARPKLVQKLIVEDKTELTDLIMKYGVLIKLERPIPAISRDPKDDMYLSCALVADCDFIVTGDNDLLCLKTHSRAKIVSPAEFLGILEQPL